MFRAIAVLALAISPALLKADMIPVGIFQYHVLSPTSAQYNVINLTGARSGGAFPVATQLVFYNLSFTEFTVGHPGGLACDGTDPNCPSGLNPYFSQAPFDPYSFVGATFDPTNPNFQGTEVDLNGSSNPGMFMLLDNSLWMPDTTVLSASNPIVKPYIVSSAGYPRSLVDGDSAIIYLRANSLGIFATPEPGSLWLVAAGFAVLRWRSKFDKMRAWK